MVAPLGRRLPGVLPPRVLRRRIHRLKTRVRVRQLRKADTDNPPLQQKVYSRAEKCATTVWPNMVWRGALSTRGICKSGRYPAEIHGMPDDSRAKSGRIVLFRQSPRGSGSSGLAVPIVVDARGERFLMDEGRGKSRRAQTPLPAAPNCRAHRCEPRSVGVGYAGAAPTERAIRNHSSRYGESGRCSTMRRTERSTQIPS
jgi:hypothetical protein